MVDYRGKWAIYCQYFKGNFAINFCKIIDYNICENNMVALLKVEDFMTYYTVKGINFSKKESFTVNSFFVSEEDIFDKKLDAQKELTRQIFGLSL